jgi:uncharacterized protein YpmB
MNLLKLLRKKGINTDILVIILLVIGLAIAVVIFLMLSSQGKQFLTGVANLSLT